MSSRANNSERAADQAIRDAAARWVVRRDRRLTGEEAAELQTWLAADARHAAAFAQSAASWSTFQELGLAVRRAPESLPPARPRAYWPVWGGLAAAALVLGLLTYERRSPRPNPAEQALPAMNQRVMPVTQRLADGSVVRLKNGAEITVVFSPDERRVRLVRGEAFFTVAKDKTRPFYVESGDVTVRAVGTAFSVRGEAHAVDVLVTEGTVQVTPPREAGAVNGMTPSLSPSLVSAGYRAVVARVDKKTAVVVSAVSPTEIAQALAWNTPMLELAGATLGELVTIFTRQSGVRIEIADPSLNAVRIGGRFPNDDIDGFVRVLEEIYDVKSERRADGSILLHRAR